MPHCTHRVASGTTCPSASVVRFLTLRLNIFKKAKATPIYNQSFKTKNGYCLKKNVLLYTDVYSDECHIGWEFPAYMRRLGLWIKQRRQWARLVDTSRTRKKVTVCRGWQRTICLLSQGRQIVEYKSKSADSSVSR